MSDKMSDKLQYLGYGLLGTPKGRQQTASGVDKQLNLAPSFDLEQQFGGCLPDPKTKDFTPLYRLSFQQAGQYPVLGIAEYRPIYEQGQTRAGTYFGAFIEAVHHAFDENQSELLVKILLALSSYQTKHFINQETQSYTESLNGKSFEVPQEPLLQISAQMQPLAANLLSQTESQETLYIACEKSQALEALRLLLNQQLYYRFKQIFFSESSHISQQMQGKKIPYLTFTQLKAGEFYLNGWKNEVHYLHGLIKQSHTAQQQLATELKQEREQQNQRVEAQLKAKMGEIQSQIEAYQRQAAQAEQRAAAKENFAKLGEQIYTLISQNAHYLGDEMAQFAKPNPLATEIGNLRATVNDIRAHLSNLHNQTVVEQQVTPKTNLPAIVLGSLAGLFGVILLGIGVMSLLSDDKTISQADYKEWQTAQQTISQRETKLAEQQSKAEELRKQLDEIREKFADSDKRLAETNKAK